ncbi:MAG: hypothetical protein OXL98_12355, partial [Acidimicrobiaceae bacterium]|nr:hypothetical protein [Acidimicrobiaceae bacterium]
MFTAMVGRRLRGFARAVVAAVVVAAGLAAPATAQQPGGFGDVAEGAWYRDAVEALARGGVFAGTECAQGFCGDDVIDRYTMAVWIVRVVDGEDPAPVASTRFADVDAAGFYGRFVERLAELGVTEGCAGDGVRFCGGDAVDRAEMAVFVSRAFDLPAAADAGFVDVAEGAWYRDAANRLAAARVTDGCGDGTRFCPGTDTKRAEIATFLARASGAIPKPQPRAPALRLLTFSDRYTQPAELRRTGAEALSLSPDESRVVHFQPGGTSIDDAQYAYSPGRLSLANADGTGLTALSDNAIGRVEECYDHCGTFPAPVWSPDSRHIAYTTYDSDTGQKAVFTASADGTGATRLMGYGGRFDLYAFEWSPDGGHIAYRTYDSDTGQRALFTAAADGTGATKLTDNLDDPWGFVWSPDGGRVAYSTDDSDTGQRALFVAAADGTGATKLTDDPSGFVWSPDGGHIAYGGAYVRDSGLGGALFVAAADGTGATKLTDNLDDPWGFVWSPDGGRVAYSTDDSDTGQRALFVAAADGTGATKLTDDPSGFVWSPDGGHIAYGGTYVRDTGRGALFVVAADGTGATKLTDDLDDPESYVWSPDGGHIAYSTDVRDTGQRALFVAAADGTGATKLTDGFVGFPPPWEGFRGWSPDGGHIAYSTDVRDTG